MVPLEPVRRGSRASRGTLAGREVVYTVLKSEGTLDQDEIVQRTLLPKRTVRYALDKLERADLISEEPGVTDAWRRRYRPKRLNEEETG